MNSAQAPTILLEAATLLPYPGGYALAYGSHATDTHQPTSDLDLLYTGDHPLDDAALSALTAAVVALHHRHGLDLDEEVPYPVKLYATGDQVDQAAALTGFQPSWGTPPPTVRETWFLSTDHFRLRLVFNVLTSPHVFLGGNITAYDRQVRCAERSAAVLAQSLTTDDGPPTLQEAWAALWQAPDGRTGKDYLGYLVAPHLLSVLTRGLTDHTPAVPRLQPSR
ncbi:nucleotidyltransferase domain-containing protein [[Kitasatospora] papulosa]|uniref:nucleotidyltransferase domain-containing protein n=1 Tax=[Kitasatospora] papulosa TaxID=1464011 RepID=UPI002E27FEAC|nr:nucleotidyltransferase domain-containing protein [[Kitasatospora] papulosa]